jgi:hypothetical protein
MGGQMTEMAKSDQTQSGEVFELNSERIILRIASLPVACCGGASILLI